MAYAAVISLKHTISGLLNCCRSSSNREILEFAHDEVASLQKVLERFNDNSMRSSRSTERLNGLEGQMRDCVHELEDVLELHESIEGELEEEEEVRQEITSFTEQVKKMKVAYIEELSKQDDDDDDPADEHISTNIDFGVDMVSFHSEVMVNMRDFIIGKMRPDDLHFYSLVGEVGSGRTIVANRVFEDLRNRKNQEDCLFDCSAWVTVGSECELKQVMIRILAQLDNLAAGEYDQWLDDEKLVCKQLYKALNHRRYMIVLDDVHDVQLIEHLRSSCPDQSNGSIVLFTTSSEEAAQLADRAQTCKMRSPDFEKTIWPCLRWFLFHDEPISAEIEEAGMKITENCRGLTFLAAKIYLFLCRREKSPEQWSKLAADKQNPIFMVDDELSERLEIKTEMQSYNWNMDDERERTIFKSFSSWVDLDGFIKGIKMEMHPERLFSKMQIVSLFGMAGIGKTKLARIYFKDMPIVSHFDHRVWLSLGPKYLTEEILIDILAQIYPTIDKMLMKEDEKLVKNLCAQLSYKRCFIVLDDLWRAEPLYHLKNLFPDIKGTTLVTTRLAKVAKLGGGDMYHEMKLLDKEESWYLLCEKVFAQGLCPPELETAGRKIAENCDGLPLLILTVAEQLLKVEVKPDYWNNVASGKEKSVFINAHQEISKALLPSYESLPQHLKECFLYIGVFRNKYEIPTSKLTNLWIAEGFLQPNPSQILEDFVAECLCEFGDRSLVMIRYKVSDLQIKTCRHHSVVWHLSNTVAEKNKSFHAMNSYADCSVESIKSQRRLCIRNSVLLGIKDVYNAMESSSKSRVFLCTSLPHQYPVPLYFGSRLLRVLDALAIRFYEFPVEVVELNHLKYLGLTCNEKLPSSISKLWKLQHLIVSRQNITTRSSEDSSLLPVEIWDMKELKHIQVMGGYLPNPKCGDGLRKLSTLLDVSAQSCTKKVLKRIPNLKRLGLRIELAPDDKGNHPFRSLNRISRLRRLESLKCEVINPQISSEVHFMPVTMFPSSLKSLSLSGFGFPWDYMFLIGGLKNLEVLKIKRYAFRGSKWEIGFTEQFVNLKFLLLEDTNLVHWEVMGLIFMELRRLSIKHCYKLQKLPILSNSFEKLELVDCNPAIVSLAEEIRSRIPACHIDIHLSWIGDGREE